MSFTLAELREGTSGRALFAQRESFPGASIDSRGLEPGEVFFALRGEKRDGHDYAEAALAQGAGGVVIAAERAEPALLHRLRRFGRCAIVAVDEPQAALARAGAFRRSQLPALQVAAVTGTNGKTTTKQILSALLATQGSVLATKGNLNNHLGVPLTLLSLENAHRFAVIEMGASGPNEIDFLAGLVRPKVCVLTNVAPSHLDGYGSLEVLRRSEAEVLRHIPLSGTFVVNADDPSCVAIGREFQGNILKFSLKSSPGVDVCASEITPSGVDGMSFVLRAAGESRHVRLPLVGEHNVSNALAASGCALALGLDLASIVPALEKVRPAEMRSEVHVAADGTVVFLDCYNANPLSMSRALEALVRMEGPGRKVAVLGQMNELGAQAREFHRALGGEAARLGIDWLLYTGEWAAEVVEAARAAGLPRAESFPSHGEILSALARDREAGERILVKGSRGARMERVARQLLGRVREGASASAGEAH